MARRPRRCGRTWCFNLVLLSIAASDATAYYFILAVSNCGYIIFNFLNLNAGWIHRIDSGHIARPYRAPTIILALGGIFAFVNAMFMGAGAKVWNPDALWCGFIAAALIIPVFAFRHYVQDKGKFPPRMMEDLGLKAGRSRPEEGRHAALRRAGRGRGRGAAVELVLQPRLNRSVDQRTLRAGRKPRPFLLTRKRSWIVQERDRYDPRLGRDILRIGAATLKNKAIACRPDGRCDRRACRSWRAAPRCWTPSPMPRPRSSAVADWRVGIQELLNRLGRATDVSRVTLFEFHKGPDGEPAESCRYDWAEPGYARLSDDPRYHNIPLQEPEGQLHEWALARQRGEIVQATLHEVTGETRQTFLEHGTQSFISVPIMLRAGVWGFLGLDDCRDERVWHALEIDVLKTAAALIAGAIERAATDEALRSSRERYALAARGANDGLWDWDLTENRTYFSPRLYEILGLPEGTLASPKAFAGQLEADATPSSGASTWPTASPSGGASSSSRRACARMRGTQPRWVVIRGLIVYRARRRHPPGRLAARHHRPQAHGDRPARQRDPRARHPRHRLRRHHHHRYRGPDRRVQQRRHPHLRPCARAMRSARCWPS